MGCEDGFKGADAWARLRFAVVGPLLTAPLERGQLYKRLRKLAAKQWNHPVTGEPVRFGVSTIERWYYTAKNHPRDPVGALRRQVRKDAGTAPSMSQRLRERLHQQYTQHRSWSYKLHADNLAVLVERDPSLGPMPSHASVRRYMKRAGLVKRRPPSRRKTEGTEQAAQRLEQREVRSYEVEQVNQLHHTDFHKGSRKVLTPAGRWLVPHLFAVLDDCSRLCAHAQWYLDETAETTTHGFSQVFAKRGLPGGLMSDNGSGFVAAETTEGLETLGVVHRTTLTASPYQNGKQEDWWGRVEERLMPMLEGEPQLTLELLNEATQAWVEFEYHREPHSELGMSPLERYLQGPDVARPSPSTEALRQAFRLTTTRSQRRSDGTVSIEGQRFEIPNRYRHLSRVCVRYARWDLRHVHLIDPRTGQQLSALSPLDKAANADGRRRSLEPLDPTIAIAPEPEPNGVAPLLEQLLERYRSSGQPPAYLPKHDETDDDE